MIVRYLWCAIDKTAAMLGSTSISRLQKTMVGWSSCVSYVCVARPKADGSFSIC